MRTTEKSRSMEVVISNLLRLGVVTSAMVIFIGFMFYALSGKSGYPGNSFPISIPEIFQGLLFFKPFAIIMTGLLLLILTPVLRVGVSIIAFAIEKNHLYVLITSFVFVLLLLGFFMGKAI